MADLGLRLFEFLGQWRPGSADKNLQVYGNLDGILQSQRHYLNVPVRKIHGNKSLMPLAAIGIYNATNFSGFLDPDSVGSIEPTFYVDDIELLSVTAPAVAHLTINVRPTHPYCGPTLVCGSTPRTG